MPIQPTRFSNELISKQVEFEFEWKFYALSGSKAIFRVRIAITYSHNLFSPVMMIT